MTRSDRRDPLDRFEQRWRRWASRPPATPPEVAARRVAARLEDRARGASPSLRWAAAAAVLALAIGVWWLAGPVLRPPEELRPTDLASALPVLNEGVVLLWLDSETPLYMTLTPPSSEGAGKGDGS